MRDPRKRCCAAGRVLSRGVWLGVRDRLSGLRADSARAGVDPGGIVQRHGLAPVAGAPASSFLHTVRVGAKRERIADALDCRVLEARLRRCTRRRSVTSVDAPCREASRRTVVEAAAHAIAPGLCSGQRHVCGGCTATAPECRPNVATWDPTKNYRAAHEEREVTCWLSFGMWPWARRNRRFTGVTRSAQLACCIVRMTAARHSF